MSTVHDALGSGGAATRPTRAIAVGVGLETFFAQAPRINPHAALITGMICGHRVEEIGDPLMQQIRYLGQLVDELARGKTMTAILRGGQRPDRDVNEARCASAPLNFCSLPCRRRAGAPSTRL